MSLWRAYTQEKPEPGARSHADLAVGELEVEAPDSDAAVEMFDELLPEGWRLTSIRRASD